MGSTKLLSHTIQAGDVIISHILQISKEIPESISNLPTSQNVLGEKQGFEPGNIVIHAFNYYFMLSIE